MNESLQELLKDLNKTKEFFKEKKENVDVLKVNIDFVLKNKKEPQGLIKKLHNAILIYYAHHDKSMEIIEDIHKGIAELEAKEDSLQEKTNSLETEMKLIYSSSQQIAELSEEIGSYYKSTHGL